MVEQDFIPKYNYKLPIESGKFTWQSPSNIALVKYWGKKEHQIPENPSISFTLNTCKTTTTLKFKKRETPSEMFSFEVFLDDKKQDDFKPKIETFFKRIETYLPFLKDFHFTIETSNSFPHSSGIASSASGMGALALCLMSIERELVNADVSLSAVERSYDEKYFCKKASFLARLGSGSACRSIEGDLIVWGKHSDIKGSSDLFGVKYPYQIHDNFKNYQDTILLVDKDQKKVSSTVGHNLMLNHPFAEQRFEQANNNISKLIEVFKTGNLKAFIEIVESEALTLHAMMMTSMPYFILMKPNTLEIINKIWNFRKETNLNVCFTLDAGANVHVLYPQQESKQIFEFIKNELLEYCFEGEHICDKVGFGAKKH